MSTRLVFMACDQHLAEALRSVEGKLIRAERTGREHHRCIDGHAAATWAIREVLDPMVELETDAPFTAAYDIARHVLGEDLPPTQGGRLGVFWKLNKSSAEKLSRELHASGHDAWIS